MMTETTTDSVATDGASHMLEDTAIRAIRSRSVADQHFVFEMRDSADEILVSMKSDDPLHTAVIMNDRLVVIGTVDEQRRFYQARFDNQPGDGSGIIGADIISSIGTDWYGFDHLITKGRDPVTGRPHGTEVAALLPATEDEPTIAGEMGWARPDYAKASHGDGLPLGRVEIAEVHAAWLARAKAMDAAGLAELYSDDAQGAVRDYPDHRHVPFESRAEVQRVYEGIFARNKVRDINVVLRLVEDWFVLAELRWVIEGRDTTTFRTAHLMGLTNDNLIRAHIGYGTNPEKVPNPKTITLR